MIKLYFKTIALMSSILFTTNSLTKNAELSIPHYSYDETLPEYNALNERRIDFRSFGRVLDFDFDMNRYTERESVRLYLPLYRNNPYGNFYYKIVMTDINDNSYLLVNGVHKETDFNTRGEFSVPFQIIFEEMGECSKFEISIWDDENIKFPFEFSFYLSSPNIVNIKNQYVRVYSKVNLTDNILKNYEDRIEFINISKVVDIACYFKFYSDQMYLKTSSCITSQRYGSAFLLFLDNANLLKKAFNYHSRFQEYRGAVLQSFHDNPVEGISRIFYQRAVYVDQETHMCSLNSKDFKRCVATRDVFFPINKYDEYKMVNFRFYIMDVGRSKTDICYDFIVRFGDKHIQDTLDVSRESPVDKFAIKMKEVIL